jgi:transposase-like protein
MKIRLMIPDVNASPTERPRSCPYCEGAVFHRHATLKKPIKDHRATEVEVHRYKCLSCRRTFRHYPAGVGGKDQSQRTVVLAALMYAMGLSCSAASHILGALGAGVCKMTVWRDAQEAGEALRRKRPAGRVRVMGADETVSRVKGEEVVVGFAVDSRSGGTLGFEVLFGGSGRAFWRWLSAYAEELGVEALVSDDNDSYSVAAAELGLSHQLCVAHVRKYVANRSKSILEQARKERGADNSGKLAQIEAGLKRLRELLGGLEEEGGREVGRLHRRCLFARPPDRGGGASSGHRMRMLTLELWNDWKKMRLHLSRPELLLDGTNNASERSIAKSKVRYKTMRGHKSTEGMENGVALTQWLYNGEDGHDLAREMVA